MGSLYAARLKESGQDISVPTPAIDRLYNYIDPNVHPVADGSDLISMA
jgi:hypothetical protein